MTPFAIRSANGSDLNFIYATWLRSYRNDSEIGISVRKSVYFDSYQLIIDNILAKSTTRVIVACKPDEPEVIFGYLVAEPTLDVLHYAFTKEAFFKLGVAKSLYKTLFLNSSPSSVSISHMTHQANDLCKQFNYNPFLLYSQGGI